MYAPFVCQVSGLVGSGGTPGNRNPAGNSPIDRRKLLGHGVGAFILSFRLALACPWVFHSLWPVDYMGGGPMVDWIGASLVAGAVFATAVVVGTISPTGTGGYSLVAALGTADPSPLAGRDPTRALAAGLAGGLDGAVYGDSRSRHQHDSAMGVFLIGFGLIEPTA